MNGLQRIHRRGRNSQSTLALKARLDKISRTLHNISYSIKNEEHFRWQEGLRADALYYPQFMQISPGSFEVYMAMNHRRLFKSLCKRNKYNSKIVKLIKRNNQEKYFLTNWSLKELDDYLTAASTAGIRMQIRDFPPRGAVGSDVDAPGSASELLKNSI